VLENDGVPGVAFDLHHLRGGETISFVLRVVSMCLAALVIAGVAAAAPERQGKSPSQAWRWCHSRNGGDVTMSDLCASGHTIFSYLWSYSEQSGYRNRITGFRRLGPRRGIVDTRGDWYVIDGDPVNCNYGNPPPENCVYHSGVVRARYRTHDGGRHWLPVPGHVHRHIVVTHARSGESQSWDLDVLAEACDWAHVVQREEVDGTRSGFGNYCSPTQLWLIDP